MNGSPDDPANPYVGPRAFTRHDTLFGRDVEKVNLLSIVISERVVLLYSPSGAGKTSLIQAGVIPALEAEKFRPLPIIRVNRAPSANGDGAASNRYVASALHSLAAGPDSSDLGSEDLSGITLSEYLDRLDGGRESTSDAVSDPVVLIFDQFEEILTVEPADLPVKDAFFAQVGEALRARHRWALFSMREEYVAALHPYLRHLPARLATTYRLGLLEPPAAREAIQKPSALAGVDFTDAAAADLIAELAKVRVRQPDGTAHEESLPYIEPVQLQVVCTRFWERLPWANLPVHHDRPQIEPGHVKEMAQVDDALAEYYDARIAAISASASQAPHVLEREIREWISAYLITERGTRAQLRVGAEREQTLTESVIQALVDAYLIRREGRPGDRWYELAHDRLVQPIRESNAAWLRAHLEPVQLRARQWDETGRRRESLLRGGDLRRARRWLAQNLPVLPTWEQTLLTDYLDDSKTEERSRLLRIVGVLAFIALLMAGGLWYLADRRAIAEADQARAEQEARRAERQARVNLTLFTRALATESFNQGESGEQERGALLARQAFLLSERAGILAPDRVDVALRDLLASPYFSRKLHSNQVKISSVSFSSDGQTLASGGDDGLVRLWNLADPTDPIILDGHEGSVESVAISPDGQTLISGGEDGTVQLWNVSQPNATPRVLISQEGAVYSAALSPDGKSLASGGIDGKVRLWNLAEPTADPTVLNGHDEGVSSVAFSPDGRMLASGSWDETVRLWDLSNLTTPPTKLTGHSYLVGSVAFSPDGRTLASGGNDRTVRLWNLTDLTADPRVLTGHKTQVLSVAFGPDGRMLASSDVDGTVRLWDLTEPTALSIPSIELAGHESAVSSVAFSPDGKTLASGSQDETVRLWNLMPPAAAPTVLMNHETGASSVAFSPDGKFLASGGEDGTVRLWDLSHPNAAPAVLNAHQRAVHSVAFSPDGRTLASGSRDMTIRLWDVTNPTASSVTLIGHEDEVASVAFSPDGRTLASGSWDKTVRLWDLNNSAAPIPLTGHKAPILAVAFSPDGQRLATGSLDRMVWLWDLNHPDAPPVELTGHKYPVHSVAFSPDGRTLASGSRDMTIRLWDVTNPTATPIELAGHEDAVLSVAFSPDGQSLASGSRDDTVRLWDLTPTATHRVALTDHEDAVLSVAFSLDGRTLASGSLDGTVRLWIARTEILSEMVCDTVGRNLTAEEWRMFIGPEVPYERTCPDLPPGLGAPPETDGSPAATPSVDTVGTLPQFGGHQIALLML